MKTMIALSLLFIVSPLFAQSESDFLGIYRLKVTIREKSYTDFLELAKIERVNNFGPYEVAGSFTVPGVFSSKFKGELCVNCLKGLTRLKGKFVAKENGETREVELIMIFDFQSVTQVSGRLLSHGQSFAGFAGGKLVLAE